MSYGKRRLSTEESPKFVVGELVYVKGHEGMYRVQQVLYRSWLDMSTKRYKSGYGYKLPLEGPTGHYWLESELDNPPAHKVVKWIDCFWQPKELREGGDEEE